MVKMNKCCICIVTSDLFHQTNDAKGVEFNWLYFVPLVMFCAFFMMNLVLGILKGYVTIWYQKKKDCSCLFIKIKYDYDSYLGYLPGNERRFKEKRKIKMTKITMKIKKFGTHFSG